MKGFGVFLIVFASMLTIAADLTTKAGKTYKDYEVDKATPHGLSIFHESGTATIPYAELPDDLRKKYAKAEKEAPQKLKILESQKKESATAKRAEEIKNKILPSKKIVLGKTKVMKIHDDMFGVECLPEYIGKPGTGSVILEDDENVGGAYVFIVGLNLKGITTDSYLGGGPDEFRTLGCWEIGTQDARGDRLRKFTVDPDEAAKYYLQNNSATKPRSSTK